MTISYVLASLINASLETEKNYIIIVINNHSYHFVIVDMFLCVPLYMCQSKYKIKTYISTFPNFLYSYYNARVRLSKPQFDNLIDENRRTLWKICDFLSHYANRKSKLIDREIPIKSNLN